MIKNRIIRYIVLIAGIVSLILGIIGIFLPLLPTTPFVLLTAYCFAKSSNKLHLLLLNHKYFGKILQDFTENRIIRRKNKIIALTFMWTSLILSVTFFMPFIWVKVIVIGIGISVTVYILKFPSELKNN